MSNELEPLTARQAETLEAVRRLSGAQGYPPTLRELAKELGNTPTAVHVTLKRLMRKGHVTMRPGISRSVLVRSAYEVSPTPVQWLPVTEEIRLERERRRAIANAVPAMKEALEAVLAALPEDDEPTTAADVRALADGMREYLAGRTTPARRRGQK